MAELIPAARALGVARRCQTYARAMGDLQNRASALAISPNEAHQLAAVLRCVPADQPVQLTAKERQVVIDLLNAAGEPEPSPRAALLAALCARQQCSALDPSLYNMEAVGEDAGKYSSMSDYIEWTRHHKSTDEDVGIVAYVTKTPGVGGLLKVS